MITQTSLIVLSPSELHNVDSTIHAHLDNKIGSCEKTFGYIVSIESVAPYGNPVISKITGNCIFQITYTFNTLKPEVGQEYATRVVRIFPDGLFARYKQIEIFIPTESLVTRPRIDSVIRTQIQFIRYDSHNFRCIGVQIC